MSTPPETRPVHRSIATVCLSGTLEDKLAAAAGAGFHGVEVFANDLVTSWLRPAEVRRTAADLGLSIDLYQPFRDAEGAPAERFELTLRRADHAFDVMHDLGTDTLLVCSSVAPDTVDDDGLAAAQLRTLADLAGSRGLRIAYEALAWGRHVSTWEHAWRIVQLADHPALGLCLDSFHILSRRPEPPRFTDVPAGKIFFVQLADAPRLAMDVVSWSRHHRVFPGQGSFDLVDFTARLLDVGYAGPLSLEVFNDVFRQADPSRTAVDAARSLLVLEEQLARRDQAGPGRALALGAPPPPPEVLGHAFTEIAVDGVSQPRLAAALTALGFTHTGQHRSKPVELWEQGEARIVLNSGVVRAGAEPGGAAVTAIAVESGDPGRAAARAVALHAPRASRHRGRAESDLAVVRAPDGTQVLFCRTPDRAGDAGPDGEGGWVRDFLPTGEPPAPGAGLLRTDHVALAQPFDHFDEAGLFYRSVLGLEQDAVGEFAAPYGLVRTQAVADPGRRLRIALNVSLLRRGAWAPGVPDPQHVAFATDDLFAAAARLRQLGAPLLPVPDNYYDDLAARERLAPGLLDDLRRAGALHDRDEHGEFLHLYTDLLGSRVFFEVLQRVGGYRGYGAVNAPVRMAAHRHLRLAAARSGTAGR